VAALMRASATAIGGAETVLEAEKGMGAEDFAYMTRCAPGAMFMLGAAVGDFSRPHHTPVFNIDESTLPLGAAMLADVTCQLLAQKAGAQASSPAAVTQAGQAGTPALQTGTAS